MKKLGVQNPEFSLSKETQHFLVPKVQICVQSQPKVVHMIQECPNEASIHDFVHQVRFGLGVIMTSSTLALSICFILTVVLGTFIL